MARIRDPVAWSVGILRFSPSHCDAAFAAKILFFLLIAWSIFGGLSRKPACAKGNAIAFGTAAGP
jgi:hypothetical protein